jgi:predicted nucleic acid-binding Zn ribbon protein
MEKSTNVFGTDKGLGDTVARLTSAVGIKPCGGCGHRREILNRMVPYMTNENVEAKLREQIADLKEDMRITEERSGARAKALLSACQNLVDEAERDLAANDVEKCKVDLQNIIDMRGGRA